MVTDDGDCDDGDAEVYPGAPDAPYDGVDADCDGGSDYDGEATGDAVFFGGEDCDDDDPDTYPGATDTWYDGVDSDCDGASDYDADADGHDATLFGGDCDDEDPRDSPGRCGSPVRRRGYRL